MLWNKPAISSTEAMEATFKIYSGGKWDGQWLREGGNGFLGWFVRRDLKRGGRVGN